MKSAVKKMKILDGGGASAAPKARHHAAHKILKKGAPRGKPLSLRRQIHLLEERSAMLRFAIQEAKEAIFGR